VTKELKNRFSWSTTRDSVFQDCLRQYYFNYYGFWGGWRGDASARIREIYVLKQLQTRQMWAGEKVHLCIERSLNNLHRGVALLCSDEAVDITLRTMRSDFRFSRSKQYWQTPKGCALIEHEYEMSISDTEWKAVANHVRECLKAFYASELWEQLKAMSMKDWLEVEEFSRFLLYDVTVFVKLDCCFRSKDHVVILDWKTGKSQRRNAHALQLVCYTLYACARWGKDPSQIEARECKLPGMEIVQHSVEQGEIEDAKAYIRGSMTDMRSLLKDKEENEPMEEAAFTTTEDDKHCRSCNFRKVCPKW